MGLNPSPAKLFALAAACGVQVVGGTEDPFRSVLKILRLYGGQKGRCGFKLSLLALSSL